jgi:hypothetical protein
VIFYTEKFYYNSVEKIQIGLISDKNIRHFTCDFELLLGQTPLGASTANTGTGKGRLLLSGRTERLPLVHLRPYISLYFICASGRQETVVSPLRLFLLQDQTVARVRTAVHFVQLSVSSGSTTVRGHLK